MYDELRAKEKAGAFINKVPYVTHKRDAIAHARYKDEEARIDKEFRDDCVALLMREYGITIQQAEAVYRKAYQDGHASGYYDVLNQLEDMDEILRAVAQQ